MQHPGNLTDIISLKVAEIPNAPAVRTPSLTITYAGFDSLIRNTAAHLHSKGIRENDVIAAGISDELTLLIVMLATARMGATFFSIPEKDTTSFESSLLERIGTRAIVTDRLSLPDTVYPTIFLDLSILRNVKQGFRDIRAENPQAPWLIISGSGSTGKSKNMHMTHWQQVIRMELGMHWLPVVQDDIVASMVHLNFHVSKMLYLEAFASGLCVALIDKNSLNAARSMGGLGITILHATVFHIQFFLQSPPEEKHRLFQTLKVLLVGGSTVPSALRRAIRDELTPNLFVRYGSIEVDTATVASPSNVFDLPETVGRVVKGVTLEIVDGSDRPLPPNKIGNIRIKSPGMLNNYVNDEEASRALFRNGWFYPKDLGKMTEDGQLVHLGRSDDMITLNGINIHLSEIESVLVSHPDIFDAAALALPSETFGHIPVAVVRLRHGCVTTGRHVLLCGRERLRLRAPRRIVVVADLPRNSRGKVLKYELISQHFVAEEKL